MSGDVQPRKRKDKKRKKDDLGVEEPRGTAAALGEGDVFMHSQHEHGTGGHWCAKIIFFSLLAVLITLIGLIILENRGLSELEANAVESRYSGVLEGWLEDAPDDDHHDEHTLELTHHDEDEEHHEDNHLEDEDHDEDQDHDEGEDDDQDEDEDHDEGEDDDQDEDEDHDAGGKDVIDEDQDEDEEIGQSDEADDGDDEELDKDEDDGDVDDEYGLDKDEDDEQHDLENEDEENHFYSHSKKTIYDEDEDDDNEDDLNNGDESEEQSQPDDEDDEDNHEESYFGQYKVDENDREHNKDNDDDESNEIDHAKYENSIENDDDDNDQNLEDNYENNNEDDEEHEEDHDSAEEEIEVEKLEREEPDEEPLSTELPALPEDDDDDNDDDPDDKIDDGDPSEAESDQEEFEQAEEENEYLENDYIDDPEVEPITTIPGKPLPEVEEEISSEQPPDTLAEEEEYEKRQEELRREEEQSSHMWLKLTVGGALLVATHAVMRRATRSHDSPDDEEPDITEDIPLIDRRLTLIPEEQSKSVPVKKILEEISERSFDKVIGSAAFSGKTALGKKQESEEEEKYSDEEEPHDTALSADDNKELYSDDEQAEDDEEIVEEPKQIKQTKIKQSAPVVESKPMSEPEGDLDLEEDDVEIIDDEQLEEELEEEDEEEISDVDDAELLTRLEEKYGKLPEPERPGQKFYKDGGNSIDDVWPGEPSDAYWRDQLDSAERELLQGKWSAAVERTSSEQLRDSGRARWINARALDDGAEARRDNSLLSRAIAAYLHLLKMNERLSDKKLVEISARVLDRIQFRGNYVNAEPVYRLLIRRFPNDPSYRNNLTISYLMANRPDLAEDSIKETLKRWPDDRLALAHYGFVLKTKHSRYEEAAEAFRKALDGDTGPANEARFYYHYGDSLLLLGRFAEAHEVHKRGASLGHFLSPAQRSLYNVPRLKSSPWWKIEETPYINLAKALEKSWRDILKEAEAAKSLYEKEKEGLKERGEWSQLDLFARGREIPDRCKKAPVTCSIVKSELAAVGCRRGQIKFSAMEAGTHVRPHVGPTNCRLRMHLGLSNTKDTYIRVDQEIRQWREGKTLMFDDSFEHEVWHNGTGTRLVLIVDVWHPQLTPAERRQLPAI